MKKLLFFLFLTPFLSQGQAFSYQLPTISKVYVQGSSGPQTITITKADGTTEEIQVSDESKFKLGSCIFDTPTNIYDLTSGFKFKYDLISKKGGMSITVPGFGTGGVDKKTVRVVIEYMQTREFYCGKDCATYGAGLRVLLTIKKAKGKLDVTNLPQVAAEADLGKIKASLSISTVGISGPAAIDLIPTKLEFNVDSYHKYLQILEVIRLLYDEELIRPRSDSTQPKLIITPQLLPVLESCSDSAKVKKSIDVF